MPVVDSRNRRVPGLRKRGDRYYGVLWVERPDGRRVAEAVATFEAAQKSAASVLTAEETVDLKAHWRQLAKRLHPDLNDALSEESAHLWERVMNACE
jgi:hypothetical protein